MLCRDPHAGGFLHQGNVARNEYHRTTSDLKQEQFHLVLVEIDTNVQDWLVHVP